MSFATLKRTLVALAGLGALTAAGQAWSAPAAADGVVTVNGAVAQRCSGGSLSGGGTVFDLGVMVDTATGLLLNNLTSPEKTLIGAFCNAASTVTVTATPMVATSFQGTLPSGFTNQVDYTATASGWTTSPATFTTSAASNPTATQNQPAAFSGAITVGVSGFTPVGGNSLRLVADPRYQGDITVTLAVAD